MQTVLKFPNGVDLISHTQNISVSFQSGYLSYAVGNDVFSSWDVVSQEVVDNIIRARTLGLPLVIDLTGDEPTYDWPTLDNGFKVFGAVDNPKAGERMAETIVKRLQKSGEEPKPVLDWEQAYPYTYKFTFGEIGFVANSYRGLTRIYHCNIKNDLDVIKGIDIGPKEAEETIRAFLLRAEFALKIDYPEEWAKAVEFQKSKILK